MTTVPRSTVEAVYAVLASTDDSWYVQSAWEADARRLLEALAARAEQLEQVAKFAWLTVDGFERLRRLPHKDERRYFENLQRRLAEKLTWAGITLSYLEHRAWPERDLRRAGIADAPVKVLYDRANTLLRDPDDDSVLPFPESEWIKEARLTLYVIVERVERLEEIALHAWHCADTWQKCRKIGGSTPIGSTHSRLGELLATAGIDRSYLDARDAAYDNRALAAA